MKSKYFGFEKVADGHMVFGKDLNKVIDDIDEKLNQALGAVVEAGAAAGFDVSTLPLATPPAPGAWTQIPLDDEVEIIFPTAVKLGACRVLVVNDDTSGGEVEVAFALASAPTTPISTVGEFSGSGLDTVLDAGGTEVAANEEVILIARNKESDALTGTPDIQVSVEAQKVLT